MANTTASKYFVLSCEWRMGGKAFFAFASGGLDWAVGLRFQECLLFSVPLACAIHTCMSSNLLLRAARSIYY
eukprot:scaffold51559_cov31-Tisochrysis_lutea.AAC.6